MSTTTRFVAYCSTEEDDEPSQDLFPESRLAIAVIERAFLDATAARKQYESKHEIDKRKDEARRFLMQEDNIYFDILGLNVGWIARLLADYRNFLKTSPRGRSSSRMLGQRKRVWKGKRR